MMALVRLALRRPLSVAVMALLMLVMGVLSFSLMNVDIFPAINLPVVMVVWSYPGLNAVGMERRLVIISERAYSTTVDGIEHMESESILGIGIIKVYFQPGTDIGAAIAQINAVSETILRQAPSGTTPPNIISYNAANVPVAQMNIYSDTLSEQQLHSSAAFHDTGLFVARPDRGSSACCCRQPRSQAALRERPIAGGYRQCAGHDQRRHSVRHGSHG